LRFVASALGLAAAALAAGHAARSIPPQDLTALPPLSGDYTPQMTELGNRHFLTDQNMPSARWIEGLSRCYGNEELRARRAKGIGQTSAWAAGAPRRWWSPLRPPLSKAD